MARTARVVSLLFLIGISCPGRTAHLDPKAEAVVERTRTTRATYVVYGWRSMDGSSGDWAAEFNSGALHRVENSINRIVADCSKMTGAAYDLATGEIDRGAWTAKAACGIQSLTTSLSSKWLGQVETPFGRGDRILITDAVSARTYDVLDNGVIAASTYHRNSDGRDIVMEASDVSNSLPKADIFSESSLQESVVPDRYKQSPTH